MKYLLTIIFTLGFSNFASSQSDVVLEIDSLMKCSINPEKVVLKVIFKNLSNDSCLIRFDPGITERMFYYDDIQTICETELDLKGQFRIVIINEKGENLDYVDRIGTGNVVYFNHSGDIKYTMLGSISKPRKLRKKFQRMNEEILKDEVVSLAPYEYVKKDVYLYLGSCKIIDHEKYSMFLIYSLRDSKTHENFCAISNRIQFRIQ